MCHWMRKYTHGIPTSLRPGGRFLVLLLCACLLAQSLSGITPAFAAEDNRAGPCKHHPTHTAECGYIEEAEGSPCRHEHDEDCGYEEPTLGSSGSSCMHEHDEDCGYRPAVEGQPCKFICTQCASIPVYFWRWIDEEEILLWVEETKQWGVGLPGANEENRVTKEVLKALLPAEATVWLTPGTQLAGDETLKGPSAEKGEEPPASADKSPAAGGLLPIAENRQPAGQQEQQRPEDAGQPAPPLTYGASSWEAGEGVQLPLTWDFSALPAEGAYEGEYLFTASLPEEYFLAQEVPKLSVLVVMGGELYATTKKYVNQWSFISRDQTKIKETQRQLTAALPHLDSKSADEVIQWLKDTVLPEKIAAWGYNVNIPVMKKAGWEPNEKWSEGNKVIEINETTCVAEEKDIGARTWGEVGVEWDHFPSSFSDGDTFTLWANVPALLDPDDGNTYQLVVNSNDVEDYKPQGGVVQKDSLTKADLLSLTVTLRDLNLAGHTVPAADPVNTTVNLFDYWVKTREPSLATTGDILDKTDWHDRHTVDTAGNPLPEVVNTAFSDQTGWNLGINRGHLLLFGDGMIHAGLWNKGGGQGTLYGNRYAGMEGIVENTLTDGYPVLNTKAARNQLEEGSGHRDYTLVRDYELAGECGSAGKIQNLSETLIGLWETQTGKDIDTGSESLSYLFDPDASTSCRETYQDVKGLFRLDSEGYYSYNMRKNFAEFDKDGHRFVLYDAPATFRTDNTKDTPSIGNFFPFNKGEEVFNGLDGNALKSTVAPSGNAMNHHLGMTVNIDFSQPLGGTINMGSGGKRPMTFQFSGDDDVWVYIDDVLVLDIGGIHSDLYGTINFATGDVCIGRAFATQGIPDMTEDPADMPDLVTQTTLLELYQKAGRKDSALWNGNTFASNTTHTLKMFYLERGNYDSSLALRFNLQPMLYQQIRKVDQNGEPIPGVEFELYPAKMTDDTSAISCFYTDSNVNNKEVFYVKQASNTRLVTVKTGSDGFAQFLDDEKKYFNFADRGDQYYILHETKAPAGYRKQPVDIVLHYDSTTSMLTIANRWSTGAYAVSVSNMTAIGELTYGQFNPSTEMIESEAGNKVGSASQENGLIVAVPMMLRQSDDTWQALFGSNLSGFHASPIQAGADADARRKALLRAVLEQAQNANTPNWFLSWNGGDRRLSGVLNDLPGLASRYQTYDPGGDMRMVCAIIEPEALAALGISEATAQGRYQALGEYVKAQGENGVEKTMEAVLRAGGFNFLVAGQFGQEFRSLLYIPNEQRELWVQKVNQNGIAVNGAEFGLYRDKACTHLVASGLTGTAEGQEGILIFSPRNKNEPGYAQVIWAAQTEGSQERAHYYLKEISAPAGCSINHTVIPVVVGTYSIYADAGTPEDGVSVMAGVGRLTQTMRQYAIENDVDITLQDITAFGQTQPSANQEVLAQDWTDMTLQGTNIPRSMNLHFGRNAMVDYGLHNEDGGKLYKPLFVTDSGFIRARVRQNYAALIGNLYDGIKTDANKENLKQSDLTDLFSLLNIVVVTDQDPSLPSSGRLTVSKRVTGNHLSTADYTKNFTFTIQLTGTDGQPLPGTYYFHGTDKAGYLSHGDVFPLHHDESITILGLPAGTRYRIQESKETGWYVSPSSGEITGEILSGGTSVAAVTNSTEPLPETGSLEIKKTVAGEGADKNRAFTFTLLLRDQDGNPLTGSYDYAGSKAGTIQSGEAVSLRHGESVTITGLPAGTVYAVQEKEANLEGYITVSTGETGTIQKDDTALAAFINSTEPLPEMGSLEIKKTVAGEGADKNRAFTFTLLLRDQDGNPLTGSYDYAGSKAGTIQSGEAVSLRHGESITITGLPVGTRYSVSEREANQDGYATAATGGEGTIQKEQTATAAFINSTEPLPETGALEIKKTVAGEGADKNRAFTFTLLLQDQDGNPLTGLYSYSGAQTGMIAGGGSVSLRHGESITITGLPAGTRYSVTEREADQKGYTTTSTDANGIIREDQTAVAAFVNTATGTPTVSDPDSDSDPDPSSDPDSEPKPRKTPKPDPSSHPDPQPGEKDPAETGDRFLPAFWLALAGISLAGTAACLLAFRRGWRPKKRRKTP